MIRGRFGRRRVGVLLALLVPVLILLHGLGSVEAQFPKPPGGGPNPPFGPKGLGPRGPLGPKKIVYDWRCSNCRTIIATTTTPFSPGVASCPNCGVRFINGGKHFLNPPANMPPPGNMPPGNTPPGNFPPPGNAPPGNMPPGNFPPPGNAPPGNAPPGNFAPPDMPPANMPPAQPPVQPPVDAPVNPVVAPPADPAALGAPAAAAATCQWCNGEVSPGSQYCWRCKLVAGGVAIGGTLVVVVGAAVCAIVVFVLSRSGAH